MEISDYQEVLNEIGQIYVKMRKDCLISCANLLDTHEMTLAEKKCMGNCFKKLYYATHHFHKLANDNLDKVNRLNENLYSKKF
jgi:hypothetical protein